jgi:hypothetical protein
MSSREFSAELLPEQGLRNIVLLSGAIATIAGFALIIHMPLNAITRVALVVTWLANSSVELWILARTSRRIARIGISQLGDVWVRDPAGQRVPVVLLAGSVVLARFAWIRVRFEDGRKYAELVSGNAVKDRQWHRFQLIWKQSRQIIGHTERS